MNNDTPVFRAPKRRKVFRRKEDEEGPDRAGSLDVASGNLPHGPEVDLASPERHIPDAQIAEDDVGAALRKRRVFRKHRGGIEFSNSPLQISAAGPNAETMALMIPEGSTEEEAPNALDAIARRFAPQAGLATNVADDKIMKNYIDSELARIQAGAAAAHPRRSDAQAIQTVLDNAAIELRNRDPATDGKLEEVDLGPSATTRNATMTEAATRGHPLPPLGRVPPKIRLGRDGKPRRKRWRRNSEDMKRDEIVEAIMKETKLDIYDEPEASAQYTGDQAADEALADEFRREFLEALEAKNKQKRPIGPPPGPSNGPKSDNPLKGPKLGGSRSARAAMHAQEKEKATQKK